MTTKPTAEDALALAKQNHPAGKATVVKRTAPVKQTATAKPATTEAPKVSFTLADRLRKEEKIVTTDDLSHPKSMIIYGQDGVGKTWLALSISQVPTVKKVLYVDLEKSTRGTIATFPRDKIDLYQPTPAEALALYREILNTPYGETGYDAIVFDSLTELQHAIHQELVKKYSGFDLWREYGEGVIDVARQLHTRTDFISILNAHEKTTLVDGEKDPITEFALSGNMANAQIGRHVDLTIHLSRDTLKLAGEEKAGIHTLARMAKTAKLKAKNRFSLDKTYVDTSFPKLWKLISESIEETNNKNSKEG